MINGQWICKGAVLESDQIYCEGNTKFKNFLITGGEAKKQIILDIPKWDINHQGVIDFKEKTGSFVSNIKIGEFSHINVTSIFKNEKFSSKYHGVIDFEDVQDLVSLQPKGTVIIKKGSLSISKSLVQIESALDIKDLALSQFFIGKCKDDSFLFSKGSIAV